MSADIPDTMRALHQEHARMGKLLDVIQQQQVNLSRHDPVPFRVLKIAFDYLAGYPEKCHHPKEDLVYKKLCSRIPNMAQSVGAIVEEHAKLAHLTQGIGLTLSNWQSHAGVSNDALAAQLVEYLDFYRHHMATEENLLFPVALASLSSDDWAEIDYFVFDQSDPLLDQDNDNRFTLLRDELTLLGKAEKTKAVAREEAAWLDSLRDIREFNVEMRRNGQSASLTHSSDGGYSLVCPGLTTLHIPACSESRAAWCAYFFLKGHGTLRNSPVTLTKP